MDSQEAINIKTKIKNGLLIGLDDVIDCNTEIDGLITLLKFYNFEKPLKDEAVKGNLIKE